MAWGLWSTQPLSLQCLGLVAPPHVGSYVPMLFLRLVYLRLQKQKQGEGNGTPLQYSCLENPMDGKAW